MPEPGERQTIGPARALALHGLGAAVVCAGITFLVVGLWAMVRANVGRCGTGAVVFGPPCPKGAGWTIFLALPMAIAGVPLWGFARDKIRGLGWRRWAATVIGAVAGVLVGVFGAQ